MHFIYLSRTDLSIFLVEISVFANSLLVAGYSFRSVTQKRLLTIQQKPTPINEPILRPEYHLTTNSESHICIHILNANPLLSLSNIRHIVMDLRIVLYLLIYSTRICALYVLVD